MAKLTKIICNVPLGLSRPLVPQLLFAAIFQDWKEQMEIEGNSDRLNINVEF